MRESGESQADAAISYMRYKSANPPRLFQRPDGLCMELERYLAKRQKSIDEAHFADNEAAPRKPREYYSEAVTSISTTLSAIILSEKIKADRNGFQFVPSEFQKSWAFALLAYCKKHDQPPPQQLMDLIFYAMGCQSLSPSPRFAAQIGVVGADIENKEAAAEAAHLDGIASAENCEWSKNALSKKVGVSRTTIARWRRRKDYQRTVDIHREQHLEHLAIWEEINGDG